MSESRSALGKRIQKLRRKLRLTQEQLAEKAGLSPKHLGELERARGNPTLSNIEKLASAMDISLAEMFDYKHEKLTVQEMREELSEIIGRASDQDIKIIYRFSRMITK